jgi:hypothetical protein
MWSQRRWPGLREKAGAVIRGLVVSSQSKKRQDCNDDNDQADDVNDVVHEVSLSREL